MAWIINNLQLDGDKVTEKIGSVSLEYPNAHNTESYNHPPVRFPLGSGTGAQQLTALKAHAEEAKTVWVQRRVAEDNLSAIILNKLNS